MPELKIKRERKGSVKKDLDDEDQFSRSSSQYIPSSNQSEHNIDRNLNEHMCFMSKEATLNAIKQYHIDNDYKFVVVESKPDIYVAQCKHHEGGCQWRLRASFSKIRSQWEIKKIDAQHSCLSTNLLADHVNLDSTHIASMVLTSVKANPSVRIKSLIAEIKNLYGYTITYRKAWLGKQKVLALAFGDWEQSYNDLPRWLEAVKESNSGIIVQYIASPCMVDGVQDNSCYTLDRVFWSFKPCIDGFNFCKPIVQVDGTFLTGRYHGTLLTAIAQDGNRNIFPLPFAIVEGETREALICFFQLLRQYVTPQPNLCMITDRGTGIISALQSEEVGWEGDGLVSVYCICHIASNFNKKFKNVQLKQQLINMAYEMKQPIVQAKLLVMRSEFKQAFSWIDCIPLKKWTQAYDGGKRFNVENSEFDVQELTTPQHGRRPQSYTVRLNDRWCDCGHFQDLRLPCRHVIAVCSSCHLQMMTFIDPVYNLHTIRKAY
ncbi:uncharacterized protein [Phaseolus vulgaris]|uniref:uncharacterized protein n=1 Tax=Phaseolus vulgaris TaxID=3885 RepID=UPI0035CC8920